MALSKEEWLLYVTMFILWVVLFSIIAPKDPPEGRV